jgi:putative ABC transport system substrate-binding protein
VAARAQQAERVRRVGVLTGWSQIDPYRSWIDLFVQGLAQLGWVDGRNMQIDVRWTDGDIARMRTFAQELTELHPDVIFAGTTPVTRRAAAGNPYHSDRVRSRVRSCRRRGRTAAARR